MRFKEEKAGIGKASVTGNRELTADDGKGKMRLENDASKVGVADLSTPTS